MGTSCVSSSTCSPLTARPPLPFPTQMHRGSSMARMLFLFMGFAAAPAVLGWGVNANANVGATTKSLNTTDEVSSLGYPCHFGEFQRAGVAPKWNDSCDQYRKLVSLHVPKTAGESVAKDEEAIAEEQEEPNNKCWVFLHLVKSGGSTIKKMLFSLYGRSVYSEHEWRKGDQHSLSLGKVLATGNSSFNVVSGGYAEALRRSPAVESRCRFFTMFRHPVSRMVSAYFYCQENPKDTLCASVIMRAREVDLLTFAKHWSNFGVLQFALKFVPIDDVMAYAQSPKARELLPQNVHDVSKVPAWYLLKMYLNRPEAAAAGRGAPELVTHVTTAAQTGNNVTEAEEGVLDAALYQFLKPAQDLLSNGYAAVGLLEEFTTSLSLFNATLQMPGMDWHQMFQDIGGAQNEVTNRKHFTADVKQNKADLLEMAWTDPELKRSLWLDLLLYEHAVDVFRQQAQSHGLL